MLLLELFGDFLLVPVDSIHAVYEIQDTCGKDAVGKNESSEMMQFLYHTETLVQSHADHSIDLARTVFADSFTLLNIVFFKHSVGLKN